MTAVHLSVQSIVILDQYDGPTVVQARDSIGGHYIGFIVDREPTGDQFAFVGVPPEELGKFRRGDIDLRSLALTIEGADWYLAAFPGPDPERIAIAAQATPLLEFDGLPDPGFVINRVSTANDLVREARTRNNLVLVFGVEPPEALTGHRVHIETLGRFLGAVQRLVRCAYQRALRDLSEAKRLYYDQNAYVLDAVVSGLPGSFKMVLEPTTSSRMFGVHDVSVGLEVVDFLFRESATPERALDALKNYDGHLSAAYIALLELMSNEETDFFYEWAEPAFDVPHQANIKLSAARHLVAAIHEGQVSQGEEISYFGVLRKADADNGDWRLETEHGSITGTTGGDGPSLSGLKIGDSYRFECYEWIETFAFARERKRCELRVVNPD